MLGILMMVAMNLNASLAIKGGNREALPMIGNFVHVVGPSGKASTIGMRTKCMTESMGHMNKDAMVRK